MRRFGVQQLELVEDAVQSAMLAALSWSTPPANPTAWLYRAAYNALVQVLRKKHAAPSFDDVPPPDAHFAAELADDMLRMLFVCCDDALPWQSRLVLALKTLCGFSTQEIALRLVMTEANVHKRLARARESLRDATLDALPVASRLPTVHDAIYLLFNEGYLSSHAAYAIRRELCEEAIRLATLLADHPIGAVPETFALLALMHLHAARFAARIDANGGLVLLEDQDRTRWDPLHLQAGAAYLARSATGDVFSRFHAEAGIAAEHCFAPSFRETRWAEIAALYALLEPSPLHTLNRAVAIAEHAGPLAGLALLDGLASSWLADSYLWDAVLGDLHRRAGHADLAQIHRDRALAGAPTPAVRALLARRLG